MDTPHSSRLRYVDADDIDDNATESDVDFDGLDVKNSADDKLGDVNGFVVDGSTGRPYYVVVDSGGWFKSRQFLLPVGHARLDRDGKALRVDLTKDQIQQFPEFDKDRFDTLSEDELGQFQVETAAACCPTDTHSVGRNVGTGVATGFDRWRHYDTPSWWRSDYRVGPATARSTTTSSVSGVTPSTGRSGFSSTRTAERSRDREEVLARETDSSPYPGGRAQPGDVLGVETGGEQTHVGETTEDENKRRRSAEEDLAKKRRD